MATKVSDVLVVNDIPKFDPRKTTIFLDKTGTITSNVMVASVLWINNLRFDLPQSESEWNLLTENGSSSAEDGISSLLQDSTFDTMLQCCGVCNTASFNGSPEVGISSAKDQHCNGMMTDVAILKFVEMTPKLQALRVNSSNPSWGVDKMKELSPEINPNQVSLKFNSRDKICAGVFQGQDGTVDHVFVKGAPNNILSRCSHISIHGEKKKLTENNRNDIKNECEALGNQGIRILSMAYRECSPPENGYMGGTIEEINYPIGQKFKNIFEQGITNDGVVEVEASPADSDDGLIFLGLIGFSDPPRPSSLPFITSRVMNECKVHMVTGDLANTALHVAKEVKLVTEDININDSKSKLISSFNRCDDVKELLTNYNQIVFSRITPNEKEEIVKAEQERGQFVIFIGDGVNDAMAISAANYGIAMGISGAVATKQVADAILLTDDLMSLTPLLDAKSQGDSK